MATSKTTNTYNRQNWEDSEFPILCQTCLGDNPYIRMTKERYGKECKICNRPFTVFRWCPGARMRFKKTEVCQTCCRLKNVCQTCLLDLEYGLPIQVRDSALKIKDDLPRSDINKEYYIQNIDAEIVKGGDASLAAGSVGKVHGSSDLLLKLARTTPYYKRNRPHICSFWVKGECKRGEECPYRHEKPTDPDDPLADQNIKDRYYGVNDPVADKLLRRAEAMPKLDPPEDHSITTLYIGNLGEKMSEKDLRDHFYQYGEIRAITMVPRQQCAFVQYTQRSSAEMAAERTFNKLILHGRRLTIKWGRSQARQGLPGQRDGEGNLSELEPVPGLPGALPLPPDELHNNFFNLGGLPGPPIDLPPGQPQFSLAPGVLVPPPLARPPVHAIRPPHGPPPPGSFFFPGALRPPMHPPPPGVHPPPPIPGFETQPLAVPGTSTTTLPNATPLVPPGTAASMPKPGIHYPSQDPARLGATQGINKAKWSEMNLNEAD